MVSRACRVHPRRVTAIARGLQRCSAGASAPPRPSNRKDPLPRHASALVSSDAEIQRDKAFAVWSYACIGQVRFLDFSLPKLPYWSRVLARLRAGASLVDAGCCFGQEIRFLAFREGIAAAQLHGFDLEPAFIDLGYELFRDRDTLPAQMLAGDVLADPGGPDGSGLEAIEGKMDIVHAASLLHSWAWEDMVTAAKRLVSLTRKRTGSMIVGNQMGSLDGGQYPMPTGKGVNYRHDVQSMERFWAQVGEETSSSWRVEAEMFLPPAVKENLQHSWAKSDPNMRMIWFCAERVG